MTLGEADLIGDPTIHSPLGADDHLQFWSGGVTPFEVLHTTMIVRPETFVNYRFHMNTNESQGETFGEWLRRQIERREWIPADLARRVGVSNGTMSLWLRDQRKPSPTSVDRIADALGVDVDTALTLAGHRPPTIPIDPDSATARLMPLIEQIDWESRPGRIEEMEAEMRHMLDVDRRKRQLAKDRRQ